MKNNDVIPILLRKKDAAALISVSVRTLDRLIARGAIRSVRIGGRQRIARVELERLATSKNDLRMGNGTKYDLVE